MICGIGLDIVQAARMESLSPAAVSRIFTSGELQHAESRGKSHKAESLAGIYAAKEAFCKASGVPLLQVIRETELQYDDNGAPRLTLAGSLAESLDGIRFSVSITHDGGISAAVVIAER